jgi:hypothetical protein
MSSFGFPSWEICALIAVVLVVAHFAFASLRTRKPTSIPTLSLNGDFAATRDSWLQLRKFLAANGHGKSSSVDSEMLAIAKIIDQREREISAARDLTYPAAPDAEAGGNDAT